MGGMMQQQPKMSLSDATSGAGLVLDPLSNMYYKPSTGQFYQTGVASVIPSVFNALFNPLFQVSSGLQRIGAKEPSNALSYGGYTFNPFTGSAEGITNGLFSPIGRYQPSPQTFEAPVGILNSLFGDIQFPGAAESSGPSYGAGRFLGNSK